MKYVVNICAETDVYFYDDFCLEMQFLSLTKKYLLHWFLWKLIKYFKYAHACTFLNMTLLSFDKTYVSKTKIVMQQILLSLGKTIL